MMYLKKMIKFKWEKGTKYLYFANKKDLAKELRKGNVDEHNELSDDFIINESYGLGEWEYKTCDKCCYDILDSDGDVMEHECL